MEQSNAHWGPSVTDGHLFQIGSLPSRTLYCLYSTATKTFPFTKLGSTAFFFLSSSFFFVRRWSGGGGKGRVYFLHSCLGDCVDWRLRNSSNWPLKTLINLLLVLMLLKKGKKKQNDKLLKTEHTKDFFYAVVPSGSTIVTTLNFICLLFVITMNWLNLSLFHISNWNEKSLFFPLSVNVGNWKFEKRNRINSFFFFCQIRRNCYDYSGFEFTDF